MISLPSPVDLERRCVALAMLDAILSPEWQYRYHSFNRAWDEATGARMASMRDGCGDEYFVLFFGDGLVAVKGLAHESAVRTAGGSVPGVLDGIPPKFAPFTNEPAFSMESTSFALWFDGQWCQSATVTDAIRRLDGSTELLGLLCSGPDAYAAWASGYFEVAVDIDIVARFFRLEPLTPALIHALRRDVVWGDLSQDLAAIGYPIDSSPSLFGSLSGFWNFLAGGIGSTRSAATPIRGPTSTDSGGACVLRCTDVPCRSMAFSLMMSPSTCSVVTPR